jgi:hypothetical protein
VISECIDCGLAVSTKGPGVHREVLGWVPQRAQGGGNVIRWAEPTGRFLCPACAADREHHHGRKPTETQNKLFGGG